MSAWQLVIADQNCSSWSLRAWLLLRQLGIPFEEIELLLDTPAFARDIGRYAPSRRVPVLIDGAVAAWLAAAVAESAVLGRSERGLERA